MSARHSLLDSEQESGKGASARTGHQHHVLQRRRDHSVLRREIVAGVDVDEAAVLRGIHNLAAAFHRRSVVRDAICAHSKQINGNVKQQASPGPALSPEAKHVATHRDRDRPCAAAPRRANRARRHSSLTSAGVDRGTAHRRSPRPASHSSRLSRVTERSESDKPAALTCRSREGNAGRTVGRWRGPADRVVALKVLLQPGPARTMVAGTL